MSEISTTDKAISVSTKMVVSRTVKLTRGPDKDIKSKEDEELLEIHHFATTPAMAIVEIPIVMSKNYQSIGIRVGVHLPCYSEELDDGITKATQMALDRVQREIPELREALEKLA